MKIEWMENQQKTAFAKINPNKNIMNKCKFPEFPICE